MEFGGKPIRGLTFSNHKTLLYILSLDFVIVDFMCLFFLQTRKVTRGQGENGESMRLSHEIPTRNEISRSYKILLCAKQG